MKHIILNKNIMYPSKESLTQSIFEAVADINEGHFRGDHQCVIVVSLVEGKLTVKATCEGVLILDTEAESIKTLQLLRSNLTLVSCLILKNQPVIRKPNSLRNLIK